MLLQKEGRKIFIGRSSCAHSSLAVACICLIKLEGKLKKAKHDTKPEAMYVHRAGGVATGGGEMAKHTGQSHRRPGFIISTAHEITHLSFLKIQQSQAPISQSLQAGWYKLILPQQKAFLPSPPILTAQFKPSHHLLSL